MYGQVGTTDKKDGIRKGSVFLYALRIGFSLGKLNISYGSYVLALYQGTPLEAYVRKVVKKVKK